MIFLNPQKLAITQVAAAKVLALDQDLSPKMHFFLTVLLCIQTCYNCNIFYNFYIKLYYFFFFEEKSQEVLYKRFITKYSPRTGQTFCCIILTFSLNKKICLFLMSSLVKNLNSLLKIMSL